MLHSCLDRVLHSSPFGRCIVAHWELLKYNRRRRCRLHWLLGPICARPDLVQNPPTLWNVVFSVVLNLKIWNHRGFVVSWQALRDQEEVRPVWVTSRILTGPAVEMALRWVSSSWCEFGFNVWWYMNTKAPKDSKQRIVVCCIIFCARNIALDIFSCLSTLYSLRLTPALSGKVESLLLRPGMNSCFRFDLLTLELGVMGDNCVHDRWRHTLHIKILSPWTTKNPYKA